MEARRDPKHKQARKSVLRVPLALCKFISSYGIQKKRSKLTQLRQTLWPQHRANSLPLCVSSFSSLIDVLPKGDLTREMKTIRLDLAQLPRDVM